MGRHSGLFMSREKVTSFPADLLLLCRNEIERIRQDPRSLRNETEYSWQEYRSVREDLLRQLLEAARVEGTVHLLVCEDSDTRQFLIAPAQDYVPNEVLMASATRQEFDALLRIGVDLRILI